MADLSPLGEYIENLRKSQNMSMRQASTKCGLSPETISLILRRGPDYTPRPDTLRKLTDGLNGSFEYMMRLAGHLPPLGEPVDYGPQLRGRLEYIGSVLSALPPDLQDRIADHLVAEVELARALHEA